MFVSVTIDSFILMCQITKLSIRSRACVTHVCRGRGGGGACQEAGGGACRSIQSSQAPSIQYVDTMDFRFVNGATGSIATYDFVRRLVRMANKFTLCLKCMVRIRVQFMLKIAECFLH